jgi:hypothetical protein
MSSKLLFSTGLNFNHASSSFVAQYNYPDS